MAPTTPTGKPEHAQKQGAWTKEGTDDALKCWNLERVIDAETYGKPNPKDLTLNDFMREEEGMEVKH